MIELVYKRFCERPTESLAQSVNAVMADELKALTPEEALIKQAEVLERLAAVYGAIAASKGAIEQKTTAPALQVSPPSAEIPLWRLGIEDAVVSILRSKRAPQKSTQICSELLAANYSFVSESPMHASHGALKRLSMRANADVVYVGGGKWTLASLYKPAQLQKLKERLSGRGGRSKEEHAKRTKDGMIAKGARFGRHPKFGPADIAKFRRLVDAEKVRPLRALEQCGISTAYYYQYKKKIYAWKPGDQWPPSKDDDEALPGVSGDELRAMGIIPMHSRLVGEKE